MNSILDEIVKNSIKLINYKTYCGNYDEFFNAYDLVKKELNNYYIKEIIVNDYPNLLISNVEDNNFDLMFCCHMDVVPCDKYEGVIDGKLLKGRGSFDMKSQISVIISLLKNNISKKKVAFLITSDEEIGGMCCKEIIKDYNTKLAVIPDGGKNFNLVVEEKGLFQVSIDVFGKSAHASSPFLGENAILKAMDIYNALLKIYPMPNSLDDFKTSINLSKINGGDAVNKVCDHVQMVLDIRFTNETSKEKLMLDIKKVSGDSKIEIIDFGPVFKTEITDDINKFIIAAEKILGRKMVIDKCLATSDAIYFSEKDIPVIMLNPDGDNWHTSNEYVKINSLYDLYLMFKNLL